MVWAVCVLSFGVKDVFWSVLRTMALFDETDGNIAIPQWTRWIGASVLGCGHLAMHRGEVLIGFNSLGHPLWVTHELLVHFAHGWMKLPDVLQFLRNDMDRELPSCLWVLPHVNRRRID